MPDLEEDDVDVDSGYRFRREGCTDVEFKGCSPPVLSLIDELPAA